MDKMQINKEIKQINVAKALPALRQSFSFDYGQQKREYHVLVDNQ